MFFQIFNGVKIGRAENAPTSGSLAPTFTSAFPLVYRILLSFSVKQVSVCALSDCVSVAV